MTRTFLSFSLAALIAVVLIPADAQAQSAWRTIHSDARLTASLDTTRIKVSDEGSYLVFVRWDYATPRRSESRRNYTRMVQQVQVKCSPIRVKRVGVSLFSSQGRVVEEVPPVGKKTLAAMAWDPPRAGSEGARVYPVLCQSLKRSRA